MHPRQIIRDAIVLRLGETVSACGGRVHSSWTRPPLPNNLPAVLVYVRAEKIDAASGGADGLGPLIRRLELAVEVVAGGAEESWSAQIDAAAGEIELALGGDVGIPQAPAAWDWLTREIRLTEIETDFSPGNGRGSGAMRLIYVVTYETAVREAGELP